MKLKRVFRRLAGTFAVTFFIGDIFFAAYAQAYFHGTPPWETYSLVSFFTFLMGVFMMIYGAQSFFWGSSFRWEP